MQQELIAIDGQRAHAMIQKPPLSATRSGESATQMHAQRHLQTTQHINASSPSANTFPTANAVASPQNTLDDNISILSFDDDLYDYDDHLFPNTLYPQISSNTNHPNLVYPTKNFNATVTVNTNANLNSNAECHDPVERRDRRIKRWLAQQCGFAVDLGLDFWDGEEEACQCAYNSLHGPSEHHHTHDHQHSPGPMERDSQLMDRENAVLGLESLAIGLRHRDSTRTMTTMNTVTSATTTSGTSPTSGGVSLLDVNEEQTKGIVATEDNVEGTDGVLSDVGTGTGTVLALTSTLSVAESGSSQVQSQAVAGPSNAHSNASAADDSSPHDRTGADSPLLGYPMPQPGDGPVSDPLLFPCANWVRELPVGEPSMTRKRSREKSACCAQCHPNPHSLPNHQQNHGQPSASRERLDQHAGTMNTGGQAPILTAAVSIPSSPTTPHLNNLHNRVPRSNLTHKQSSSTSSSSLSRNSVSHSRAPSLAPSSSKSSSARSRPTSATPSQQTPSLTHSRSSSQVLSISIGQALSLPPVQSHPLASPLGTHVSSPRVHTHSLASTGSSPASPVLSRRPSLMRQPSLPLLGENSVLMHSSHSHSISQTQGFPPSNLVIPPVPMTRSRAPSNASVHFYEQLPPSSLSPLPPSSPPTRRQSRAASTLFSSLSSSVSQLSELGMGETQQQHHHHQYPHQHSHSHSHSQSQHSYYQPSQYVVDDGVDDVDGSEARQDDDGESAMSGSVSVRNAVYIDSEEVRERLDRLLGVRSTVFSVGGGELDDGEEIRRGEEGEDEGQELELAERTEEWIDQLTPGADDDAYFGAPGGVHETPKKKRVGAVVPPNTPAVSGSKIGFAAESRGVSRRGSEVKLGLGHRRGGGSGSGSRSGSGSHSGHGHAPPTTTQTHGWYQTPFASSSQVYLGSGGVSEEGLGQSTSIQSQIQPQLPPTPISMLSSTGNSSQPSPRPSLQRLRSGSMMNALTSTASTMTTNTHQHNSSFSSSLSIGDTIPLPLPTPPPLSVSHKIPTRPPPAPLLNLDYIARTAVPDRISTPSSSHQPSPVELEEQMVFCRRPDLSDDEDSLELVAMATDRRRDDGARKSMIATMGGVPKYVYEEEDDIDVYRRYYEGSSEGHEAREGREREGGDGDEDNTVRRRPGVGRGPYGRYFGDDAVPSPLKNEVEGGRGALEGAVSRWSLTSSVMAGDSHVGLDKSVGGQVTPDTPSSTNPSTKGGRSRSGSTSAFAALGVFGNGKEKEEGEKEKELLKEKKRSRLVSFISRLSVGGPLSNSSSTPIVPSSGSAAISAVDAPSMPLPLLPVDARDVYVPPSVGIGALLPPAPIRTNTSQSDKPKKPIQLRLDVEQTNVQGVVALNGEVAGVWNSSSASQSRTHSLSDVTSIPPPATSKSAPGSPTTSRGRVTFKDVAIPLMPSSSPGQALSNKSSIPSMASRPSFSSSVMTGSPKGSMLPPLPTSPTMSSVPMPRSPMQSTIPMPLSPSLVPIPMSPKSPMSLKSMTSMTSMELTPQGQSLSTSPPQAVFMTPSQTQSKIVRTGSAQAFRADTVQVVLDDRPTRPRASSAADLLMMMKPRPSVAGLMERAQVYHQQQQQVVHPLSQSSVPHHQQQPPIQHGVLPVIQPSSKRPVLMKSMSMGVLSGSAILKAQPYDADMHVPLTPSSFASTEPDEDDDDEGDEEEDDEDEDEEYGVELTGEMRKWGLGMGREGERERDEREKANEERWERMQAKERVFVPVNEEVMPAPYSTNPNRDNEGHTVTVYPNTVVDQTFNTNNYPNINKISGASTSQLKPSLDINTNVQTAQHGSAFPHSPFPIPLSPTAAKVESAFMALAPTRAQLQMKQQPPLPPLQHAHTSSTLQTQPFQRLRLKSMSSVGNLPSNNITPTPAVPLPTTTTLKSKSSGFRGLAIRMGLVNAGSSTPATPTSAMPSPSPMGSNHNLLNIQTHPQPQAQREMMDPYGTGYHAMYDSPTSMTSPIGSLPSAGGILGTMKKAKKTPKRQLVISGVGVEDVQGYEAVKNWCESLGEVREIKRVANGSLYVDFKKASVAEAVCRLQAQVTIKGAGSVSVSWATKSKKTI